ncbi:MAG: extracellular solute-binding protein [Eubacterium sp.]|nr:extracellular solute-binding protein [Eubacterium sp.]
MKKRKTLFCGILAGMLTLSCFPAVPAAADDGEIVLRVANWEEYIDEGGWEDDEVIDLESGDIFGENPLIEDFEEWYYEEYGQKVRVEYSTFGTNEDLYNMLTLGDVFDLVCPSEYMIMKLIAEDKAVPLSEGFFDEGNELNYYINGVSPFIRDIFETHEIGGEYWDKYAAGYMWGVTGFVYNPEIVTREEASSWHLFEKEGLHRQITVKDNVRDTYFAALGALKSDLLLSEDFRNAENYHERLLEEMNDTSPDVMNEVQEYLQSIKDNLYSFETDSGISDMVSGKVAANFQWSGDGVFILDLADEVDYYLEYAVPEEATNIYFDGWVMLKAGIDGDEEKQQAAEAFINFISRPDNVIRNMYYVGYTSVIAGAEDGRIFEYADWCYGAEKDEEDTVDYSLAHFFTEDEEEAEDFVLTVPEDQLRRQMFSQYPPEEVLDRACIMVYFGPEANEAANQMWIKVRCYNIADIPAWAWIIAAVVVVILAVFLIRSKKKTSRNKTGRFTARVREE